MLIRHRVIRFNDCESDTRWLTVCSVPVQGVYAALTTIVKECGGKDDVEAEVFLKQLESKGCYMQDIF